MAQKKPGGPAARPRAGGGFNQLSQEPGSEHLQSSAMQQAMQQKTAAQKQADPKAGQTSPAKKQQQAAAQQLQQQQESGQTQPQQQPPREVGTVKQEFQRMGADVKTQLREFFSINTWLGIDPETEDPEEIAKRKQVHQRWQNLNKEQQAVAKKMYQEELERKKQQREEEERRKQIKEQKAKEEVPMPSSPQKGPIGPAAGKSRKKKAMQKLQQDRQGISGPRNLN